MKTLPEESDDPMGDLTPSLTRRAPVGLVKWEARQPRKSKDRTQKESKELCCALGSEPLPVVWFGVFDQGLGLGGPGVKPAVKPGSKGHSLLGTPTFRFGLVRGRSLKLK